MIKRLIIFFISIYNIQFITAQVNLVSNPSFENFSSCPNAQSQIKLATGWDTLKAGGGGTPDYFNACDISTAFSVPYNLFSFQYAFSGSGYSNIVLYYNLQPNAREYIQSRLIKKLEVNKSYCVTFHANLTNYSTCSIDEIGVYFDDGSVYAPFGSVTTGSVNPQIKNTTSVYVTDTLNWYKIQGSFVANGTEEYITIGNFKNDLLTNTFALSTDIGQHATYYIDDVSVLEINSNANAGQDKTICVGDSIFIGINEEALDCQWFSNNMQIAQGAGIWVKPTNNQQYIIKQDVCGNISYDTVQVSIKDINCNPIINSEIPNTFTPNGDGANDVWYVDLKNSTNVSYTIYNRWGTIVKQNELNTQTFVQWDGRTTSGERVSVGVYYFVLEYLDKNGDKIKTPGYISLFN